MKILLIIYINLYFVLNAIGQEDWRLYPKDSVVNTYVEDTLKKQLDYNKEKGLVKIFKDSRIDSVEKYIAETPTFQGYTIQLESSQLKETIKTVQLKFIKEYPDYPIFDEYIAPNTYLFVGRFYSRIDALSFKNKISKHFDETIVISKMIELPELPEK